MQQLNVLPINVSQSVETKDESVAFTSTSSKDDFSQHIDMHLAKSKGVSNYEQREVDNKINENTDKSFHEHAEVKSDEKAQQSSGDSLAVSDDVDSANNTQDVAASGKKTENELAKEAPTEEAQGLDESELLMSFLIKADKTLINANSSENIEFGEMSAEQKAKTEAQLLLKSSDLVANLSDIAKALKPSSEIVSQELNEQEHLAKALLETLKDDKENAEVSKVTEKSIVKGEESNNQKGQGFAKENVEKFDIGTNDKTASGDFTASDKSTLKQQLNATKLVENTADADNLIAQENKLTKPTLKESIQNLTNNDFAGRNSIQADENKDVESNKNITQKELVKQFLTPEVNSEESSKVKSTSTQSVDTQASINSQSSLEVEAKVNEQLAQLMKNKNSINKPDANLAATISVTQNSHNNKNVSTASLEQASAEALMKENDLVESEGQLNAKSVEHSVEKSKEFGAGENKDVSNNKPTVKTNSDFSVNSSFIDVTGKTTQAAQEFIDQNAAEIFNPTGSSEISQSQKTNTQLHQETISIFRKDFSDAVKDKVMLMISQKLQQFDISLDPPEFGNMQVRVNLQGEQATVNFVVQNQQAKEAFEQNMHKLKELLAEQGVDVGDANVEQQSQQSDNETNNEENEGDAHHNSTTNTADASDVIEHNLSARMINSSTTAVDYYA